MLISLVVGPMLTTPGWVLGMALFEAGEIEALLLEHPGVRERQQLRQAALRVELDELAGAGSVGQVDAELVDRPALYA